MPGASDPPVVDHDPLTPCSGAEPCPTCDPLLRSPVADVMAMAFRSEGERLCGLGYHAWLPWIPNTNGLSWFTYCVRCRRQEQFDL